MLLAHDVEQALHRAAALVNTALDGAEELPDLPALRAWLEEHAVSGGRTPGRSDLEEVHALRTRLRAVWAAPDLRRAAGIVNGLIAEAEALPQLVEHDGWSWHFHYTAPSARTAAFLAADAGMALGELIRDEGLERLRHCEGPDCTAVLVDLSRNRSRRYCDTGCGNRVHVAAYRARQAARADGGPGDDGRAEAARGSR